MTRKRKLARLYQPLTVVVCAGAGVLLSTTVPLLADTTSAPTEVAAASGSRRHSTVSSRTTTTTAAAATVQLYEDPITGQLFTRPGAGRTPIGIPAAALGAAVANSEAVQNAIDEKAHAAAAEEVAKYKQQQEVTNAALASQVQEMQPAWREFGDRWFKKVRLGTLLYADYAFYTHTSFGPQFLTQINPPGPSNNSYNSFDITRTYLNVFFSPTDDFTARITPNIYRTNGTTASATFGKTGSIGSNLNQEPGVRIKYAYLDWNTPFKRWAPISEDKITFGQQQNPLIDWEEGLYGYRFVNLVPWNYLSLSSTQIGLSMKGPIKFHEKQYVDYDFGVYNNTSFSGAEKANTKQFMARVSIYPFGGRSRFDGLGLTGFWDYGFSNQTPDVTSGNGKSESTRRFAALLHYSAEKWNLAGEFDYGHNAYNRNNMFSGSGPADAFGLGPTPFAPISALADALQNQGRSVQEGFDFFGHYDILDSPFSVFGMFESWFANTKANVNPFDFQRFVVGMSYKYNKYLRFALDSQNLLYYHDQFTFPGAEFATFSPTDAKPFLTTGVPDSVMRDIHSIFLNVEFAY